MTTPVAFRPASRRRVKIKLAVQGPSGSGKTLGALALAQGLAAGGKVAVIDTENGSASLYADLYQFDTLQIKAPYLTEKYEQAVKAAIDGGYAVVVIDSISHQWDGDGGILQRKEQIDARGGNHFSNWEPFTREHNRFRALLLHSPVHIVATMRSKMAYAQESKANGQGTTIKKLGLQPIQREGLEYEFGVVFELQMDHKAAVSKDRTKLFEGTLSDLTDGEVVKSLHGWLTSAAPESPAEPEPTPLVLVETSPGTNITAITAAGVAADEVVDANYPSDILLEFGKEHRGERLGDVPLDYLEWMVTGARQVRDGLKQAVAAEVTKRKTAAQEKAQKIQTQPLDERPLALDTDEEDFDEKGPY